MKLRLYFYVFTAITILAAGYLISAIPFNFSVKKQLQVPATDTSQLASLQAVAKTDTLVPASEVVPVAAPKEQDPKDVIYSKALKAVINIFCDDSNGGNYIFGSGVIINPKGYILTNAHLAEYFGLSGVTCTLRRGSPARLFAEAKLVYLPSQDTLIGTSTISNKDIAVIKITNILDGSYAGDYDYFDFSGSRQLELNDQLYSLGYPSEFLNRIAAVNNDNLMISTGAVSELISIDGDPDTAEVAYLNESNSAQHGSSGGVLLDPKTGMIDGLFVGVSEAEASGEKKPFIFLKSYIDEIVRKDKGVGLIDFLATNP